MTKEILVVVHNAGYDTHFITKQLAEEFGGQFECIGENTEKYITFSVPIKKEHDNGKTSTYKLKFIDSYRFMQSKLSDLVDNLSEINKKKCPKCKGKYEFIGFKNDRLHYRCKKCKKRCTKSKDGLIKKFPRIYKFCNGDLNKFVLLLRKGVYPYEYMDSWERFNETSLPDKEAFYSKLNEERISNINYAHGQTVWKVFEIKNLGENHDLYVQSDTLLLTDVFKNFRDKCIEIYKLDPAHFLSAPGLTWQACLKKTGVELKLLTDYNKLLMAKKGIKGRRCDVIYRYAKAILNV